jgi:excisionase family DNA binding protein
MAFCALTRHSCAVWAPSGRSQRSCARLAKTVDLLCDNAQMRNDANVLLSVGEVAERLGVHRATAYRYIHSGELPALRLGEAGPYRIRSDVLERWLVPVTPREEEMSRG